MVCDLTDSVQKNLVFISIPNPRREEKVIEKFFHVCFFFLFSQIILILQPTPELILGPLKAGYNTYKSNQK